MIGDLTDHQETALLKYLADMTAISNLEDLLSFVVHQTPGIMQVNRCSIYLTPEYVTQYTGELFTEENEIINSRELSEDFIVLAHTNYQVKEEYIGKIYYESGRDLTGWVFRTGKVLKCRNSRDPQELHAIDPDLFPSTSYTHFESDNEDEVRPILYLPLKANSRIIGVLKLHQPISKGKFDDKAENIASIIAQVITSAIQKVQIMRDQDKKIFALAELGTQDTPEEVCKQVTSSAREMFDCPVVQVYLRDWQTNKITLAYMNGRRYTGKPVEYIRDEGLIGWILRTGKAINLPNLHEFLEPRYLDDPLLARICENAEINDEDRTLVIEHQDLIRSIPRKLPFIGVPVWANDNSVLGVLCAHFVTRNPVRRNIPFSNAELQRLKTFASTISVSIRFSQMKKKGELMLEIGKCEDKQSLFEMVQARVPELIHSTSCFIYRYEKRLPKPIIFPSDDKAPVELAYAVGEGKTGFCALANAPLVFDHFGYGTINQKKIDQTRERIARQHPHYLLHDLLDESGNLVGVVHLECENQSPENIDRLFSELCKSQRIGRETGLPSRYMEKYQAIGSRSSNTFRNGSYSFISVPILHEKAELDGVITFNRTSDRNPFAEEDVEFIKSLAGTLGSVIHNINLIKQRNELITSLGHEINIYITSIKSDSELIHENIPPKGDLKKWSAHLRGQITRLFDSSESILGVVSQRTPRVLRVSCIMDPIREAVETYREEAALKGCLIKDPGFYDRSKYPELPMFRAELTLALKNILHNAVKYSYTPSREHDQFRYVLVRCCTVSTAPQYYCISIQNYGVGITKKEIDDRLIFKPFYRGELATDRHRTGSGFGLAYADYVIEKLHHGHIEVTSTRMGDEAHLTEFQIYIPLTQP